MQLRAWEIGEPFIAQIILSKQTTERFQAEKWYLCFFKDHSSSYIENSLERERVDDMGTLCKVKYEMKYEHSMNEVHMERSYSASRDTKQQA